MYGVAHEEDKDEFLSEVAFFCSHMTVRFIIGGNFNILHHCGEKNKCFIRTRHIDRFNSVINSSNLREIFMSGGLYTWTNKQSHPTLEKLDRILMSPDWKDLYPLVTIQGLVRIVSDHNPLLLCSDVNVVKSPKKNTFRFELV